MLSFATEFPVEERDPNKFVQAVRQWIAGSPHTRLQPDKFNNFPDSGTWRAEAKDERIDAIVSASDLEQTIAFRHATFAKGIGWTTTVVYSVNADDSWVGVRTAREATGLSPSLPEARKPFVIRNLLQTLAGGLDGELRINETALALQDNDLARATRLLNGDGDNHLPLVYVSCDFDGSHLIDAQALARSLAGMAHVAIEPSRQFSRRLQKEVESRNVYGGAIGIYWSNYGRHAFFLRSEFSSEFDMRRAVERQIRQALMLRRPLIRCTWETAEVQLARTAIDRLRYSGSEKVEDYIAAFDRETAALKEQLKEAEQEIRRLDGLLRSNGTKGPSSDNALLNAGVEQEFFPGELLEIVHDALVQSRSGVTENSRRQHVISSIISANNPET